MRNPELLLFPCSASQNLEESFEKFWRTSCSVTMPLQCKFASLIIGMEGKKQR